MLTGAHVLIFSSNVSADTEFLRDVFELPHVDAGEGFLIFGLPPSEVAIHDADANASGKHELFLITSNIHELVEELGKRSIACDPIAERGWGTVSAVTLPSGLKLGVYESHHARPAAKKKTAKALVKTAKAVRKATKKAAKNVRKEKKAKKRSKR